MNEPRWYCVSNCGSAELCFNQADAEDVALVCDKDFPVFAPHRVVQLVDAAELEAAQTRIAEQAKEIEALRTGDSCGRSCEGTAYRIEARTEKARADELQKEVDALTAERHRGLSLDALNKRIDSYFA